MSELLLKILWHTIRIMYYSHSFDEHYIDGLVQERRNSIANTLE